MRLFPSISAAVAGAALFASSVSAQADSIQPVVIKGKHFFYENGTEFFIRGVAYQRGVDTSTTGLQATAGQYDDPLANGDNCRRDIPWLSRLRTNTVRVYNVDPTQNHDDCMNQLAAAGIYVIADLSEPKQSINRNDPTWNDDLYIRYISVIDALHNYQNTLGFFAGNEVSNSDNTTEASAYVKAAVRDSKAYISQQGYRPMGVGYATYDGPIRDQLAQYFNCGDPADAIDFWGYNVYSWCGDSNYDESDYDERTNFFRDYSVPVFFAEYGCIKPSPRTFTEVPVLYGPLMTGVWSGGIVYMYFEETNNYGLVNVDGNTVTPKEDFSALSSQMARVTPSNTMMADYNPTASPTTCPPVNSAWMAKASPLPPTPNRQLCECMVASLQCAATSNNGQAYGRTFNFICSTPKYCTGIDHNGTTGNYGAYSGCNPKEQLSFVMNQYYMGQSAANRDQACNFGGLASNQQPSSPDGSCQSLLNQAGPNGGGTVAQPTGNSQQQGGSSGSGQGGTAAGLSIPSVLYLVAALMSGVAMILL